MSLRSLLPRLFFRLDNSPNLSEERSRLRSRYKWTAVRSHANQSQGLRSPISDAILRLTEVRDVTNRVASSYFRRRAVGFEAVTACRATRFLTRSGSVGVPGDAEFSFTEPFPKDRRVPLRSSGAGGPRYNDTSETRSAVSLICVFLEKITSCRLQIVRSAYYLTQNKDRLSRYLRRFSLWQLEFFYSKNFIYIYIKKRRHMYTLKSK